jgi:hypothetical protein
MSETSAEPPANDHASIRACVQTLIGQSLPNVINGAVQVFVKAETDHRIATLVDGLKRLEEAEKTLYGIKPDHHVFVESATTDRISSTPAYSGYSADQKGKKEKAQKRVDKLRKVIDDAVGLANFKALEEALKQND